MRFIKAKEVASLTSISIPHIRRLAREGKFPKPVKSQKIGALGLKMMSSSGSVNALESIILEGGIHEQLSGYAVLSSTHKDGRRYKKSLNTGTLFTRRRSGLVGRSNLSNGPMDYIPKVFNKLAGEGVW